MKKKFSANAIIFLLVAISFSMSKDLLAQNKKPAKAKPSTAEVKFVPPEIAYSVSMSKPYTHLIEVEMRLKWAQMPDKAELKMAVWTPGSYLVREYARHVLDFTVKDAAGASLAWQKINKNTWQVDTKGSKEIVATYRVYANELTVRTNELNDDHGFWNNAATLMYVKDQLKTPLTITVKPFGNWKVATGLPKVEGQTNTFRAENFDVLFDSPFEVSDFKEIGFEVEGKHHRIIFSGEGNYDMAKCAADAAKIVEEAYKIFGELPYNDYTFILNLRGGGGLEHLNSTALQSSSFAFKPESRYKSFLGLVSHEYFHAFNVKRIRPDALGPFDYENENYTKLLWVAEGGTEYYSALLLRRTGLISDKEFLSDKAKAIKALQERPGRFATSLEEASFDSWIKQYRPDENAINNQISYYDKGEIVNMMLDITIRGASNGAKSEDDVLRYLYTEFFKKGINYTPEDFQKAAEMMAGKGLEDFFSKYVRGTAEIDYGSIVGAIGLQLVLKDNAGNAYLGADTVEDNGRLNIRSIPVGTPAYEYGLNTGDQIVAIDGYRANQTVPVPADRIPRTFLQNFLAERKPNDKVRFTIFRFDVLRDITVTLGSDPRKEYSFGVLPDATDAQKKLYHDYLNADL